MIKMLQKKKRKKGFTLVELIVVIAIIAILAAILVPTIMGMVTKARITSLNTTASKVARLTELFFLEAEAAGYGMRFEQHDTYTITVANGVWNCTKATSANYYEQSTVISWGRTAGRFAEGSDTAGISDGETLLCSRFAQSFAGMEGKTMRITVRGGMCELVLLVDVQGVDLSSDEFPQAVKGKAPAGFAWDGKTSGLTASGILTGAYPVIPVEVKQPEM